MTDIVQDPKSFRPDPCPECGADQRVFGWAYVEHKGTTGFQPARVQCTVRCEQDQAVSLTA